MSTRFNVVAVVGAGAMGRGIAQIAAQAGSQVLLFDAQSAACQKARESIIAQWGKLAEKGRLSADLVQQYSRQLQCVDSLQALSACDLVIEAIVERLDIKQSVFAELEAVVRDDAVLASNTSSLSVTAIAAKLKRPQRVAGYHFFNPVPLMKVVEVIPGLKTDPAVCERLSEYAREIGHTAVMAQDTPGFIVNHAGRGYGTEALRLVSEGVTDFVTTDRILKDQVGFKLGPFELFDLTGLDVSHPVMESIYRQYFEEPRYRPNVIAAQRMAGGVVGRKVGEGFYRYEASGMVVPPEPPVPVMADLPPVWVSSRAARRADLFQLLKDLGATIETGA